jgi:uncharacterized coiled-coil protein SlyX
VEDDSQWQVDKHIPIALIVTIFGTIMVQSMAAVWWASAITTRLDGQQARILVLEQLATTIASQAVTTARLEEKINSLHEKLSSVQEVSREIRSNTQETKDTRKR